MSINNHALWLLCDLLLQELGSEAEKSLRKGESWSQECAWNVLITLGFGEQGLVREGDLGVGTVGKDAGTL